MKLDKNNLVGVDLFAGAGGMSLGAQMAGVEVAFAVENDRYAASTYAYNHPNTKLIVNDVEEVDKSDLCIDGKSIVLFGGPPCQGFSTSNQRTRSQENPKNWLFEEFIRIAKLLKPDWIVFENVRGIVETEQGFFKDSVVQALVNEGYSCSSGVLCAKDFGVPQIRSRFFLIASRHGVVVDMPSPTNRPIVNVRQAIADLPRLTNGARDDYICYPSSPQSEFSKSMRNGSNGCTGHLITNNSNVVIDRYKHIPQGGNWKDIPPELMQNYTDRTRCHSGIYRRLHEDKPSVVLGNFRKNMLVHPLENRGLSIREAARLQSFPDWYEFKGPVSYQQQQVGNAVPPLLAKAVFSSLLFSGA